VNGSKRVLVIGGGIGGIQASLDLADGGVEVILVEREPSIGGRMIQTDRTFPTLDCSSCVLTPKMVEVSLHRRINLLSLSEVVEVIKEGGGFRVKIRKNPRYVDEEKCTSCGRCAQVCVLAGRIPKEFDEGMGRRGAIFLPFPQAVPQKYLIDPESCLKLKKGRCKKGPPCVDACEVGAINFDDKPRLLQYQVDAILIATGFDLFDPIGKPELGYGRYPEVITSLELERLMAPNGPTGGEIRLGDFHPRSFFFIQCVGSRDRTVGAPFCSRVCCMYTAKHAYIVKERVEGAVVYVSYIDVRAHGKGYEEFYRRLQDLGVYYLRGVPGEVYKDAKGLIVRVEDQFSAQVREVATDMVVLACGIRPRRGMEKFFSSLGIETDDYGFIKTDPMTPFKTNIPGVFACGVVTGPKDIPDSVASASCAALACVEYIS